jgi:single-strand DNA-binding protein
VLIVTWAFPDFPDSNRAGDMVSSVLSFGSGHSFGPIPAPCGLRSFCFAGWRLPCSGSPILVPPEKHLLALGAVATRFVVPQDTWAEQEKSMYLNRLTLIGFIGADAEVRNSNNRSQISNRHSAKSMRSK